jgi:glutamate carboxypeptidase
MEMNGILDAARALEREQVTFLRDLVLCESPSDSPEAVNRFAELFAAGVASFARVRTVKGGVYGRHLIAEFVLPGPRRRAGRILGLGHSDTVWPLGTLRSMPWREANGRLWGPGVLDMKGGLAQFVFAVRVLRELDLPVLKHVTLLINSDEEVGSPSSKPLTEKLARQSDAVLVLEPGTGLEGKLKTSRKGVGRFGLRVEGVASHAGVDFAAGASAIRELAHHVESISSLTRLERGVTVNVGVVAGGTRSNVVAAAAHAEIDVRVPTMRDWTGVERALRRLKPVDKRCRLHLEGGLNRPPMERTPGVARLAKLAIALGRDMGVRIEESSTGGGSDGNFTAGLGIPTLDGVGSVGEGAHAPHESILVNRIADRTALLAGVLLSI